MAFQLAKTASFWWACCSADLVARKKHAQLVRVPSVLPPLAVPPDNPPRRTSNPLLFDLQAAAAAAAVHADWCESISAHACRRMHAHTHMHTNQTPAPTPGPVCVHPPNPPQPHCRPRTCTYAHTHTVCVCAYAGGCVSSSLEELADCGGLHNQSSHTPAERAVVAQTPSPRTTPASS